MRSFTRRSFGIVALLVASVVVARSDTAYAVSLANAASGFLSIELVTRCAKTPCEFQMPVWSATYQVRDFAQYVTALEASDASGRRLPLRMIHPSRWAVESPAGAPLKLRYRVLCDRPGPFGAYADADMANLNLAQILIYPVAARDRPFTLQFLDLPKRAKVAITLDHDGEIYRAAGYSELIDTPLLIADFDETTFQVENRQVRLAVSGKRGNYDIGLIEDAARRIVVAAKDLMGELPFETYTFVFRFSEVGGGGMEYRNGTMIFGPADCRTCTMAGLAAHEFFHAWNVKRIRPKSLDPIDFTAPNFTPSLWFAEGFTSAYGQYLRLAAGLKDENEFLADLSQLITTYEMRPASRAQSAEESSLEAWLERYSAYNRPDRSVSYYLKGELIAHLLDIEIRRLTSNARSLDDLMRRLNDEYARHNRPYDDTSALEKAAVDVAGEAIRPLFNELVRQPAPIDWNRRLEPAGYRVKVSEKHHWDAGMTLANPPGLGLVIASIFPGGPAEKAGLRRGDRVLQVDGGVIAAGSLDVEQRIEQAAGAKVKLEFERGGATQKTEVAAEKIAERSYNVVEVSRADAAQKRIRKGWLQRRTDAKPPALFPTQ